MASGDPALPSIDAALPDVAAWLTAAQAPFCLIGGVAASMLGSARTTLDIDILAIMEEERWETALTLAGQYALVPRVSNCLEFARESRVFLLTHQSSAVDVDVIIAGLSFEKDLVHNAEQVKTGSATMPVARREDLIIMKAVAQRPRDMADIEGLIKSSGPLDWPYIESWAGEFAEALDRNDIVQALRAIKQTL